MNEYEANIGKVEIPYESSIAEENAAMEKLPVHIRLLMSQHIYNYAAKQIHEYLIAEGEQYTIRMLSIVERGAFKIRRSINNNDIIFVHYRNGNLLASFNFDNAPELAALMAGRIVMHIEAYIDGNAEFHFIQELEGQRW